MKFLFSDGAEAIYLVPDKRGESESYEAFKLVAVRDEQTVWTEGIRKDRTLMLSRYREAVDRALAEEEKKP